VVLARVALALDASGMGPFLELCARGPLPVSVCEWLAGTGREGDLLLTICAFVDESKSKGYIMVCAILSQSALSQARLAMRALVLPGQRSLHMKDESAPRRREIVSAISRIAV
jgi:hypothetical protein